jgi:hypothetical protein
MPSIWGVEITQTDINEAANIVSNWLNFLIVHDVFPEYKDDILAARDICEFGKVEIMSAQLAGQALPGTFGVACSVLTGGYYKNTYVGEELWNDEASTPSKGWTPMVGFSMNEAWLVFKCAILTMGDDKQNRHIWNEAVPDENKFLEWKVVGLGDFRTNDRTGLEVMDKFMPNAEVAEFYKRHNEKYHSKLPLVPLGKLLCKLWDIPTFERFNLPPETEKLLAIKDQNRKEKGPRTFEFWVDERTLEHCYYGMKFTGKITYIILSRYFKDGDTVSDFDHILFLDHIGETHPSFYKLVENELHMANDPEETDNNPLLYYPSATELAVLSERAKNEDEDALEKLERLVNEGGIGPLSEYEKPGATYIENMQL